MTNAVLATLKFHPNPNSVFTSFITTLHKVGLTAMENKLMERFSKCMYQLNNFTNNYKLFNRKKRWSY